MVYTPFFAQVDTKHARGTKCVRGVTLGEVGGK